MFKFFRTLASQIQTIYTEVIKMANTLQSVEAQFTALGTQLTQVETDVQAAITLLQSNTVAQSDIDGLATQATGLAAQASAIDSLATAITSAPPAQ